VQPGHINLANCGEGIIIKRTDPRGVDQEFSFTSDLSGSELSCSQPSPETAQSFSLNDSGNSNSDSAANTQDCVKVPASRSVASVFRRSAARPEKPPPAPAT
jgi:hypothetical protein